MPGPVTIVAERINATRKRIGEAIASRDASVIEKEARAQAEAGADYIDVNAGRGGGANEADDLVWLVEVVQRAVDLPLCLDSADPEALRAALASGSAMRRTEGAALVKVERPPLVNSVNGEAKRIEAVLPLVKEHGASVVALTMEEGRMPESAADRVKIAERLAGEAEKAGIDLSAVYFDPCVLAASTSPGQPTAVLEAVREMRRAWPEAHVVCGLSNVSFGLPLRRLLNRAYAAMMIGSGADALIVDPTAPAMRAVIAAAAALAGTDEYGMGYISAVREGRIA